MSIGFTTMNGEFSMMFPQAGYWRRMRSYLAETYPVPLRLVLAALLYLGVSAILGEVHGVGSPHSLFGTATGIASFFAVGLMLRLMDKLKDRDIDRAFFRDRPMASGRVLESDIRFSVIAVMVFLLGANLWANSAFWPMLALVGYAMLMYRHFFIRPVLERSPILTLAMHQPLLLLLLSYAVALFAVEHGLTFGMLNWSAVTLVVAMVWSMFLAEEVARKIRAPEEETTSITYSRIWSPRGAVLVAAGFHTIALGLAIYFYRALSLSSAFLLILLTAYGLVCWGYLRFLLKPAPERSNLRPFAEAFLFLVLLAIGVEFSLIA